MIATTDPTVTLAEVLNYRHDGVVRRYAKEHGASREEAEEIFRETLKWLYLCDRSLQDGTDGSGCAMTPEIEKIDWMWHTFILFTREYAEFCDRYFGYFLHHVVNDDAEETALDAEVLRPQLERQFGLVYDVLGPETLTTWYEDCRYASA